MNATRFEMQEKIRKQARAALTGGIIGMVFFGFIFGPGAIIRAAITKGNIRKYNVGHEYLGTATTAMILGIVATSLWGIGMLYYHSGRH